MTAYAGRLANAQDTAARMRAFDAFGLFPASTARMARPGLRRDGGGVVTVVAGTMDVQVTPFSAWIDGGVSDAQGGYPFVSDATVTLSLTPGDPSLSRTDTIVAEVRDDVYDASGFTDARVRVVEGTPGAGAPALPTNCLPLRDVTVPAGLSAGNGGLSASNLGADRRSYTTGLGGIIAVSSEAERDALPNLRGVTVWRADDLRLEVADGYGGWLAPGVFTAGSQAERDALDYITGQMVYRLDTDTLELRTLANGWQPVYGAPRPGELLAYNSYEPAVQTNYSTTSTAYVDLDATNMAVTFKVPPSGRVLVRLSALISANPANPYYWALLEGAATVEERYLIQIGGTVQLDYTVSAPIVLSGLTPGATKTYKWGHRVTTGSTGGTTYAGGAPGPATMEVTALP